MALLPKIGGGTLVAPDQVMLMHKPNQFKRRQTFPENSQNVTRETIIIKKKKDSSKDWWKGTKSPQDGNNEDSESYNKKGSPTNEWKENNKSHNVSSVNSNFVVVKKKRETTRDWWKDRAEVAMSVEQKTKRRRKLADEKASEEEAGRIQWALGPHKARTGVIGVKSSGGGVFEPQTHGQTGRGKTTSQIDTDKRVRFDDNSNSANSGGENKNQIQNHSLNKRKLHSPKFKRNTKTSVSLNSSSPVGKGSVRNRTVGSPRLVNGSTTIPDGRNGVGQRNGAWSKDASGKQNEIKKHDGTWSKNSVRLQHDVDLRAVSDDENDDDADGREGSPAAPAGPPGRSVQARVKAARERARLWAETCSDPGGEPTAPQNKYNIK